jgi:hypothetical protein
LSESIPIAIVGGLGAIRCGYPAATQHIDVAIARDQLDAFVAAAPAYGFKIAWNAPSGWRTLTHDDVEINVVPEGGKAKNSSPTTIPGPTVLGVERGLDYASLAGWIELKTQRRSPERPRSCRRSHEKERRSSARRRSSSHRLRA